MKLTIVTAGALLCFALFTGPAAEIAGQTPTENIIFPPHSGVVNVAVRYGASGNGKTDDTAAIQRAIDDNEGKFRILYFPNGTYTPFGVQRYITMGCIINNPWENI